MELSFVCIARYYHDEKKMKGQLKRLPETEKLVLPFVP